MDIKNIKMSKKTMIVIGIILCLVIPLIAYGANLAYILYFRDTPTIVNVKESQESRPADIPTAEESGIENIVLFGVDNRTPDDHGRTDSIIIATIDKNAKTLKLTSVMRDLFVEIGSTKSMNRVNAAYAFGGPELALETLNKNFGLDLKYYAIIDFKAFQELVDMIGGISVDVKDYEVKEINFYIREVNGNKATVLTKPGFQHLNGQQALSFARIRQVGNGDFERTERQRIVLKSLVDEAKQINMMKVPQLLTTLASYVQTNVPLSRILSLGVTVYGFNGNTQSIRVPVEGYYEGQSVDGASVLVPDIKANAMFLKDFIYNMKMVGNKDLPPYMQNNFHMDDSVDNTSSLPKPNIPNYNTPDIPAKPTEEQSAHTTSTVIQPGAVPVTPTTGKPNTTTTTTTGGTQPGSPSGKPNTTPGTNQTSPPSNNGDKVPATS